MQAMRRKGIVVLPIHDKFPGGVFEGRPPRGGDVTEAARHRISVLLQALLVPSNAIDGNGPTYALFLPPPLFFPRVLPAIQAAGLSGTG